MTQAEKIPTTNLLIAAISPQAQEQMLKHCETVELNFAEVIYRVGELVTDVYFPTTSIISLVAPIDAHPGLEVGLVGHEGALGVTLLLGVDTTPFHSVVQGTGLALRIKSTALLAELERNQMLKHKLKRYLYVSMSQIAQTAACTRFHVVESRLARWLLMTLDRAHSDSFHVTHIFLAYILGVRRVGITKAANSLQKRKLIHYQRGSVTILDRVGLEEVSCACYRADKETYQRILG